jgi:hypothetical protein
MGRARNSAKASPFRRPHGAFLPIHDQAADDDEKEYSQLKTPVRRLAGISSGRAAACREPPGRPNRVSAGNTALKSFPARKPLGRLFEDKFIKGGLEAAHVLYGLIYGVQMGTGGPQKDKAVILLPLFPKGKFIRQPMNGSKRCLG